MKVDIWRVLIQYAAKLITLHFPRKKTETWRTGGEKNESEGSLISGEIPGRLKFCVIIYTWKILM